MSLSGCTCNDGCFPIESIFSIIMLVLTHKLTGKCLVSLLHLITSHCPTPYQCCKTLYVFKKIFASSLAPLIRHFYCVSCYLFLATQDVALGALGGIKTGKSAISLRY